MAKVKHFVKLQRVEKSKDGKAIPVYRMTPASTVRQVSEIKRVKL